MHMLFHYPLCNELLRSHTVTRQSVLHACIAHRKCLWNAKGVAPSGMWTLAHLGSITPHARFEHGGEKIASARLLFHMTPHRNAIDTLRGERSADLAGQMRSSLARAVITEASRGRPPQHRDQSAVCSHANTPPTWDGRGARCVGTWSASPRI